MNTYLNKVLKTEDKDYVVASDTDSIYLHMGPMVEVIFKERETCDKSIVRFLEKVCDVELEKYIQNSYEELATFVNAYDQKMIMKRENIANKGIWTAKKRYILNVWNSEGVQYNEPKLKMMGIEAVKSSTPGSCRTKIKEALEIMMSGTEDELQDFVTTFRKEFESMPFEDIAFPRGLRIVHLIQSMVSLVLFMYVVHYFITITLRSIRSHINILSYKRVRRLNSYILRNLIVLMRTLSHSSKLYQRSLVLTNRWIMNYNSARVSLNH